MNGRRSLNRTFPSPAHFYGNPPTRDAIVLGLGLDTHLTRALTLTLRYDLGLPLDGPDLTSHTLFAGLEYHF